MKIISKIDSYKKQITEIKLKKNMENKFRNTIELGHNVELPTELKVRKITADDLCYIENGRCVRIDLGCCIRAYETCTPNFDVCHPYTCVDYRLTDGDDIVITTCYEGLYEFVDMANYFNEQIPIQIFDRLNWEYVDCGDYWSINPSSYYCF